MKRIVEVAKLLGVTKVTIYRNIETVDLQQHVTIVDNVKYIDDKGIDILRQKLCNKVTVTNVIESNNIDTIKLLHDTEMLQQEIEHLKRELSSRDSHIETLKNDTEMLQQILNQEREAGRDLRKLLEHNQVLMLDWKQKLFSLEQTTQEKNISLEKSTSLLRKLNIFRRNS